MGECPECHGDQYLQPCESCGADTTGGPAVGGKCCSCGYAGEVETPCAARDDEKHCQHWWDGPVAGAEMPLGTVEELTAIVEHQRVRLAFYRAALDHIADTCVEDPDSAQFAWGVLDGSARPPGFGENIPPPTLEEGVRSIRRALRLARAMSYEILCAGAVGGTDDLRLAAALDQAEAVAQEMLGTDEA